jgi:hypothetical protein
MWIAKDLDNTVYVYKEKPTLDNNCWCVESGYYFEIPSHIVYELLGRNLNLNETIEVELKKV